MTANTITRDHPPEQSVRESMTLAYMRAFAEGRTVEGYRLLRQVVEWEESRHGH